MTQQTPNKLRNLMMAIAMTGLTLLAGFFGLAAGWVIARQQGNARISNEIALSWYQPDKTPTAIWYGAEVWAEPAGSGISVKARVRIGAGLYQWHECGEIGRAQTIDEAVARWGEIQWKEDGLHIGQGADAYFLSEKIIRSHR